MGTFLLLAFLTLADSPLAFAAEPYQVSEDDQQKLSRIAMRRGSAPTATQFRTASSITLAAMW